MSLNITIILVTFESGERIADALNSIPQNVRVIVVDNASQDDTLAKVKLARPSCEIIALNENIGFGRANNVALAQVKTDYVLLQNPDALLREGALEKAIEIFTQNPKVGALGIGYKKFDSALKDTHVIGGAMFFSMRVLNEIGFFDEKLFLYAEDTDICWRVRKTGYRVCRSNLIKIDHVGGSSVSLPNIEGIKQFLHGQSLAYFQQKRLGKVAGTLYTLFSAHRALPLAWLTGNNFDLKLAKRNGMMNFLKNGEKTLFDNPLAKRSKI